VIFVLVLVLVLEDAGRSEVDLWTGIRKGFVPEGLNEGSLAVYCLECGKKPNRPVRVRYDGVGRLVATLCAEPRE
jgi:hypothetical protein